MGKGEKVIQYPASLIKLLADIFAKLEKDLPSEEELYAKGEADKLIQERKSWQDQFCQHLSCIHTFNDTHQTLEVNFTT